MVLRLKRVSRPQEVASVPVGQGWEGAGVPARYTVELLTKATVAAGTGTGVPGVGGVVVKSSV
jgi:hypothetical protein